MPTEFKIPELGENVSAGDVVRILVKAGDTIEKDQPVLELETDKATIEVPSSVSGTVGDVKVKVGDKVKVGQVVFTLSDGAAAEPEKPAGKKASDKGGARRPRRRRRPPMPHPRRKPPRPPNRSRPARREEGALAAPRPRRKKSGRRAAAGRHQNGPKAKSTPT